MLALYLPAATHLKKLRMGTAGELVDGMVGCWMEWAAGQVYTTQLLPASMLAAAHNPLTPHPTPSNPTPGDLVTLVAEALDGLGVIQAFNKQAYFTDVTSQYVDNAHRSLFAAESLNLWLAFFCDFYGAAMVSLSRASTGGCGSVEKEPGSAWACSSWLAGPCLGSHSRRTHSSTPPTTPPTPPTTPPSPPSGAVRGLLRHRPVEDPGLLQRRPGLLPVDPDVSKKTIGAGRWVLGSYCIVQPFLPPLPLGHAAAPPSAHSAFLRPHLPPLTQACVLHLVHPPAGRIHRPLRLG